MIFQTIVRISLRTRLVRFCSSSSKGKETTLQSLFPDGPTWSLNDELSHKQENKIVLSSEQIQHLSWMSHLHVDIKDTRIHEDINDIINFTTYIKSCELVGAKQRNSFKATMRDDSVEQLATREEILSNAVKTKNNYFVVPKVIGENDDDEIL